MRQHQALNLQNGSGSAGRKWGLGKTARIVWGEEKGEADQRKCSGPGAHLDGSVWPEMGFQEKCNILYHLLIAFLMEMGFTITTFQILLALEWSNIFVYTCREKYLK